MIKYNLLNKYKEIAHFCTSREGGVSVGNYASFNLSSFSGDDPANFTENQRLLCNILEINPEKLIVPFQTHGTEIRDIDESFLKLSDREKISYLHGVDGLITKQPGICIGITTADCVPLLFFDPINKVIAVAHAGWRGTCNRIAEKTIHQMIKKYSCKSTDIRIAVGPSISAEVYEVGKEVIEHFETAGFEMSDIIEVRNNSFYLDLWKANCQSMKKIGIPVENIEIAGICTFTEHERFFSARRLGIQSGRMLSGIMLTNN